MQREQYSACYQQCLRCTVFEVHASHTTGITTKTKMPKLKRNSLETRALEYSSNILYFIHPGLNTMRISKKDFCIVVSGDNTLYRICGK